MSVTETLLRVYRVDQRITGLKSRLRAAERFLAEQDRVKGDLSRKREAIDGQLRQLKATAQNAEGESTRLGERIEELRTKMGTASNTKEYQAYLGEMNTLKDSKGEHETTALELMEKIDALTAQRGEIDGQLSERDGMHSQAVSQRDERQNEIAGTLEELETERQSLVGDVPRDAIGTYEELVGRLGDDAMAPLEILDRRNHEYTCGACMVIVPMEKMSTLLGPGSLTRCVSCGAILYLDETTRERMTEKSKR